MRLFFLTLIAFLAGLTVVRAQMFSDVPSYCRAMAEVASPSLLAREQNIPRSRAEALSQGMTDPAAIRMVKEVLDFAYSRPPGTPVEKLRAELRELCIARKIFVQ